MKETVMNLMKKVYDGCENGTIWKALYGCYLVLFAANMMLSFFVKTKEEKAQGRWNAVSIGLGLGFTGYQMRKAAERNQAAENE